MHGSADEDLVCEFGGFRLDTRRQLLFDAGGNPVPLASRAFDALAYLIRHRDRLIGKSELMQVVWPDVIVEDNNLNQVVTALRRVFGERRGERRFILTVSGRGYRFVADVRPARLAPSGAPPAIAVLPFVNLTGEPDKEYLGDGMAEELIHVLARVPGLRVPSHTSSFAYKGRNTRIQDIGRDLNVSSVIEGSVRSAGERIRITAQLIDARSGFHIWSQTFDRRFEEIISLQVEIAAAIVAAVCGEQPSRNALDSARAPATQDVEAYQFYLQGAALIGMGTELNARHARELFGKAVERDPRFARAICAEAAVQVRLATEFSAGSLAEVLGDCEARALQALALDPDLAEAEALLGSVHVHRLEWVRAQEHVRKAVAIDPTLLALNASTLQPLNGYAFGLMMATGHLRRGREAAERSFALAPAVPMVVLMLSIAHAFEGRDADALRFARLGEQMGWSSVPLPMILAQLAQRSRRFLEAGQYMQQSFPPATRSTGITELVDVVYRALEDASLVPQALAAICSLVQMRPMQIASTPSLAMLLMQWATCLGDVNLAYRIGNQALESFGRTGCVPVAGFVPQLWLPEMRPFRLDPRFHEFAAQRLRMLAFWEANGPPDNCELTNGRLICQ